MATYEIFVLHDIHDLAQASDGRSRYGAYLAQNTRRFRDGNGNLTKDSAEFAAAGFVVASTPIMSPPYIGTHPRVVVAAPRWDEDGRCCLLIELATPLPSDIAASLPADVVGWERDPRTGRFLPPEGNGQRAAYARLSVRLPLPVDLLPPPACLHGDGDPGRADSETRRTSPEQACQQCPRAPDARPRRF